jgi:hypothetical protein
VNAAHPAAGAALSFEKFFACSLDTAVPGFDLFAILNPTNKFIARKRSNVFPQSEHFLVSNQLLA